MDTVAALIEAIAAIVTAVTAVVLAWLAYKKFIQESRVSASENRVRVYIWENQITELRATDKGLELHLLDARPGRGEQYTLSKAQVKALLADKDCGISVTPKSKSENCGVFSIGPWKKWLYTKRLYPNPVDLKAEIKRLMETAVNS